MIGRYWLAHHWFFSRLERIDRRLLSLNLVYLGLIAFLPFPTGLLGDYEGNPIAFVSTTAALLSWLVLSPIGFAVNRTMPAEVLAYYSRY